MQDNSAWVPFFEAFVRAEALGVEAHEFAIRLQRAIRLKDAAGRVRGLKRCWEYVEPSAASETDQNQARLRCQELSELLGDGSEEQSSADLEVLKAEWVRLQPIASAELHRLHEMRRDPVVRPVPITTFYYFDDVQEDCTSHWVDDPDDPEAWASVDWVSGTVTVSFYDEKTEYLALHMQSTFAAELLDDVDESSDASVQIKPYCDAEFRNLIANSPVENGDIAWSHFKNDPRKGNRNQKMFRHYWGKIRGREGKRGRPRNS